MRSPERNDVEFKVMYDRHFESVARYCLRRLPQQIAPDAVSEIFLTAWRRFESIPPENERLPWLYAVARNVVRNVDRSRRRSVRLSARIMGQPHYPEPSPEVLIVRNEQDAALVAAMEQLSSDDQEVLRLRAYEGLSMREISLTIGCSEEAAKKRVSRALSRLRKAAQIDMPLPSGINSRATQEGGGR